MGGVRPHFSQHIVYLRALLVRNRMRRLDANGGQISGFCGHTFHNISCTFGHFSCEIGGCFFGINKHDRHPARSQNDRSERGPHHAKGQRYTICG